MTDRHMLGLAKTGAFRVAILTALGAAFAVACGGGGMTDVGSGGTNSGGAGPGSGGGTSSGGASSSGGAVGTGGSTTGGSANTGGADGMGGLGGGGGAADEDCPETMPGTDDECQGGFNSPTCTYGDQECQCQGFGMNATWECGEPMDEEECPAEAPEDGATCTAAQFCNFDGGGCICDGEEWNCF